MKKLLCSAVLMMAPLMAHAGGTAHTTGDLHLRDAPGMHGHKLGVMPAGSSVYVHSCYDHGWCDVTYHGVDGYASAHWMAWTPSYDRQYGNWERPAEAGVSDAAVAGFVFGATAVAIAGPSGALVPQMFGGGVVGAALGQLAHEGQKTCKYTNTHTGETWRDTCPAEWHGH